MIRQTLLAAAAVVGLAAGAQAALLVIDDSDPNTITISVDDFEAGFYLDIFDGNGLQPVQSGLGSPFSVTLPDGGFSFSGSWFDLGNTPYADFQLLFGLAAGDLDVTSGIVLSGSTNGFIGTIHGSIGGFTGVPYFNVPAPGAGFGQDDGEQGLALPFLSISFTPEPNAVPAPAGLALFGLGLLGLAALRRR
jgi:hypothetical protein